jgi:hypothetical protein
MESGAETSKADALFARLVARFAGDSAVTPPSVGKGRTFGQAALKVDGKIFAMVSRGNLVVKLPRERVDELVAAGKGAGFDAGKGRPMKEWLAISPAENRSWARLADEARDFVGERR